MRLFCVWRRLCNFAVSVGVPQFSLVADVKGCLLCGGGGVKTDKTLRFVARGDSAGSPLKLFF